MTLLNGPSRWPLAAIEIGAGLFIVALAVSTLFDPSIWLLHMLQALIYVAVMALARRRSVLGFGAGFTIALLWNSANLFITGFVAGGLHALHMLLRTGRISRPVLLLILVGAAGHFLMIVGCLAGFSRTGPRLRQWAGLLGGAILGVAALALISPLRHHQVPLPLDVAPRYDVLTG